MFTITAIAFKKIPETITILFKELEELLQTY